MQCHVLVYVRKSAALELPEEPTPIN